MNLKELNLEELSSHDMMIIDGGGFWYDLSYGVGSVIRGLEAFAEGASNGKKYFYK